MKYIDWKLKLESSKCSCDDEVIIRSSIELKDTKSILGSKLVYFVSCWGNQISEAMVNRSRIRPRNLKYLLLNLTRCDSFLESTLHTFSFQVRILCFYKKKKKGVQYRRYALTIVGDLLPELMTIV